MHDIQQSIEDRPHGSESASASHKSPPFGRSAEWYDILHGLKDYDADAHLYMQKMNLWEVIKNNANNAAPTTIIEWGSGTGEFSRRFCQVPRLRVFCVEPSLAMWQLAIDKHIPGYVSMVGSLTRPSAAQIDCLPQAHAACAPFAVMSYAGLTNEDLLTALRTVRAKLSAFAGAGGAGRFVFDVFNLSAAACALRKHETKQATRKTDGRFILEHRQKMFRPRESIIEINCDFEVFENQDHAEQYRNFPRTASPIDRWHEIHRVRAFSPTEISLALSMAGFRTVAIYAAWEDHGTEWNEFLWETDWYLLVVAEAV